MFAHKISINNKNYEYIIKDNQISIFQNIEGHLNPLNSKEIKENEPLLTKTVENILDIIKEEISNNIKNGKYKNEQEIKEELNKKINSVSTPQLNKVLNSVDVFAMDNSKECLKYLFEEFERQNNSIENKQEIIKQNIDPDIENIFKENGITEYEMNPYTSTVVYYQNGNPTTITKNNNETIYESLLRQINLDKLTSKDEINRAIQSTMNTLSNVTYTTNIAKDINQMNQQTQSLAHQIDKFNPSKMYGFNQKQGEMILSDFEEGQKPINIDQNQNINIGQEVTIDGDQKINTETQSLNEINMEQQLNDNNIEYKIAQMYKNVMNGEVLTNDEEELLNYYNDLTNQIRLSEKAQNLISEINANKKETKKEIDLQKEKPKILKMEFKNNQMPNAFVDISVLCLITASIGFMTVAYILANI